MSLNDICNPSEDQRVNSYFKTCTADLFVGPSSSFALIQSFNNTTQAIAKNATTALAFNVDSDNVGWSTSRADNTKFIGPISGWYDVSYTFNIGGSQTFSNGIGGSGDILVVSLKNG